MAPIKATPHRVGKLFEVLGERGEDMRFRLVLARVGGEVVDQVHVHHKDVDGYGAIVTLLRKRWATFDAPASRASEAPPSFFERVAAIRRVLGAARNVEAIRWAKRADPGAPGAYSEAGRLVSVQETQRLIDASKRLGVSMSALLLQTLNRAVTGRVAEVKSTASWCVPVNMRGPVRVEPETANASSLVAIGVPGGAGVREVDGALRDALAKNLHWGKWDQVNLMLRFGERTTRKKINQYYGTSEPARIGVFSNVGVWRTDSETDLGLIGYGPPTRMDPIFAGAMTLNGKLGLSLRAHPLLGASADEVALWLAAWLDALDAATRSTKAASPGAEKAGAEAAE